jgi:hypothetical protein
MKVHVFYHDRCFDGAASAAVFTRLYKERFDAAAEFEFTGLAHRASSLFDESLFNGDENVIVDFKYSTSPKLTWWFDHHQSAFLTPEDAEHFRNSNCGHKFYDPDYRSCTKLIAEIGAAKFGFNADGLAELVKWADIIDGAMFPDAATAVKVEQPALRIAMVLEAGKDNHLSRWLVPLLAHESLESIAARPEIATQLEPIMASHKRAIDLIAENGKSSGGVLFFDLTGPGVEVYNKFAPYYLHPDCVYSVSICPSSFRTKISVGSNPWNKMPVLHNLASICERYGGGGHPRVGAISLEPGRLEDARRIAAEIVTELQGPPRAPVA